MQPVAEFAGNAPLRCNFMRKVEGALAAKHQHSQGFFQSAKSCKTEWQFCKNRAPLQSSHALTQRKVGEKIVALQGVADLWR